MKKPDCKSQSGFLLVPRTRLELAHPCEHQPLKLACLPISPSGRNSSGLRAGSSGFLALRSVHYALRHFCAQNRTRTCTSLLTLVPETSASTNFAIWAVKDSGCKNRNKNEIYEKRFKKVRNHLLLIAGARFINSRLVTINK